LQVSTRRRFSLPRSNRISCRVLPVRSFFAKMPFGGRWACDRVWIHLAFIRFLSRRSPVASTPTLAKALPESSRGSCGDFGHRGAFHRPTEPTFIVLGCGARIETGRAPVRVGGGALECADRREGEIACRHRLCRKHRDIDYGSSNRVVPGFDHREISSSARPRVRGPKTPIESTTISMLAAMNANTPFGPKFSRKNAIMKLVKIVESRLHE
jgi:hypothetical protein